jgi:hypothetical protein
MRGEWSAMRLGDAAHVTIGRQRTPQHASGKHMVHYLRAANVKDGRLDLSDVKRMNFTPAEQHTFGLEPGDVLVTEGCGSLGQLGASAQWNEELPGTVCFQNTLLRLRARAGVTLPGFLDAWAGFAFTSGLFASVASGTNIFHLGAKRATELPILVPPIEEQRRIGDLIQSFSAVVKNGRTLISASELLLQQMTESVFDGMDSRVELSELIQRDRRPIAVKTADSYRQIGIRSHGKGIFHKAPVSGAELGNKKVFSVRPGDLVFNIVFAWEGAVAVAGRTESGTCGSHRFPTYVSLVDGAVPLLRHFFRTRRGRELLHLASPGSAGRNRTLNQRMLLGFEIPVPSSDGFESATALLDALEDFVFRAQRYQHELLRARESLLLELATGEHEIPATYDVLLDMA